MIENINIIPLERIPDERGMIMHMLRCDDPYFQQFGEIYFSMIYPGVIKGWHLHTRMTLNYAVILGMVKLVLYDQRQESKSYKEIQEVFLGEDNYQLVQIPPGIVNGYKGIGTKPAVVANCATLPYDPNEVTRIDPYTVAIPYNWEIQHR